jgi:hypothetical protein
MVRVVSVDFNTLGVGGTLISGSADNADIADAFQQRLDDSLNSTRR